MMLTVPRGASALIAALAGLGMGAVLAADAPPAAMRPPRASVAAAASVSRAFLVCRNRGLTVIVEPVLPSLPRAFSTCWAAAGYSPSRSTGRWKPCLAHAGRQPPLSVLAITSLRYTGAKAVVYRTSVSVSANKRAVNGEVLTSPRPPVSPPPGGEFPAVAPLGVM